MNHTIEYKTTFSHDLQNNVTIPDLCNHIQYQLDYYFNRYKVNNNKPYGVVLNIQRDRYTVEFTNTKNKIIMELYGPNNIEQQQIQPIYDQVKKIVMNYMKQDGGQINMETKTPLSS